MTVMMCQSSEILAPSPTELTAKRLIRVLVMLLERSQVIHGCSLHGQHLDGVVRNRCEVNVYSIG
jgi:hypothetical protein